MNEVITGRIYRHFKGNYYLSNLDKKDFFGRAKR